jgi:hypothetical protein
MNPAYGRDSRYRSVPVITRVGPDGHPLQVDDLRPRPPTPGTFRHTLADDDRLDHLGQRYYGAPRAWWRIADANPEFLSPLALIGQEAITGLRLTLPDGELVPLWTVVAALRGLAGVDDIAVAPPTDPGRTTVTVHFNRATTTADKLQNAVLALGVASMSLMAQPVSQLGKPIVVPPGGP